LPIGIAVSLLGLQRYLCSGFKPDLKRLSFAGGAVLLVGFAATFALYVAALVYVDALLHVFDARVMEALLPGAMKAEPL
jgi:hypothetical protein